MEFGVLDLKAGAWSLEPCLACYSAFGGRAARGSVGRIIVEESPSLAVSQSRSQRQIQTVPFEDRIFLNIHDRRQQGQITSY